VRCRWITLDQPAHLLSFTENDGGADVVRRDRRVVAQQPGRSRCRTLHKQSPQGRARPRDEISIADAVTAAQGALTAANSDIVIERAAFDIVTPEIEKTAGRPIDRELACTARTTFYAEAKAVGSVNTPQSRHRCHLSNNSKLKSSRSIGERGGRKAVFDTSAEQTGTSTRVAT
jgi:hypothetical protein